jgi:putative tryptophan/tyrosine transport system substrate-binding protein
LRWEEKYADGETARLTALAAQLTQMNIRTIVTYSIPAAIAAKNSTSTIPIVVAAAGDLLANGLVATLARPGGNVTGIDELVPGLTAKRLVLLNEAVSLQAPVAVLSSATGPTHARQLREAEDTAQMLGITLHVFRVHDATEIGSAMLSIAAERPSALLVG